MIDDICKAIQGQQIAEVDEFSETGQQVAEVDAQAAAHAGTARAEQAARYSSIPMEATETARAAMPPCSSTPRVTPDVAMHEEVETAPLEQKRDDKLMNANIELEFHGQVCKGKIEDIEIGKQTREILYLVRFDEYEDLHLTKEAATEAAAKAQRREKKEVKQKMSQAKVAGQMDQQLTEVDAQAAVFVLAARAEQAAKNSSTPLEATEPARAVTPPCSSVPGATLGVGDEVAAVPRERKRANKPLNQAEERSEKLWKSGKGRAEYS